MTRIPIATAATNFAKTYHNGENIFSVGVSKQDGEDCIGVVGTEEGLKALPDVSDDGYKVRKRRGGRPEPC